MVRAWSSWRHTWLDGYPQRTRRTVALVSLLAYPLSFVIPKPFGLAVLLAAAFGAISLLVFLLGQRTLSRDLDERQRLIRSRAWAICYWIMSLLVLTGVVLVESVFLVTDRLPTFDVRTVQAVANSAVMFVFTLPLATLAWIEPDPPGEG